MCQNLYCQLCSDCDQERVELWVSCRSASLKDDLKGSADTNGRGWAACVTVSVRPSLSIYNPCFLGSGHVTPSPRHLDSSGRHVQPSKNPACPAQVAAAYRKHPFTACPHLNPIASQPGLPTHRTIILQEIHRQIRYILPTLCRRDITKRPALFNQIPLVVLKLMTTERRVGEKVCP